MMSLLRSAIFERLREEHQFTGGYTIVKDYVRSAELHSREMFIPLTHAPGEAQADFRSTPATTTSASPKVTPAWKNAAGVSHFATAPTTR